MPVSHCPYAVYGQARTVNAYGHPKNLPQIRSRAVSAYGLYGQRGTGREEHIPIKAPPKSGSMYHNY